MALHIDRVEAEIDVLPDADRPAAGRGLVGGLSWTDPSLKERLRPIVMEILREELDRLRRKQG